MLWAATSRAHQFKVSHRQSCIIVSAKIIAKNHICCMNRHQSLNLKEREGQEQGYIAPVAVSAFLFDREARIQKLTDALRICTVVSVVAAAFGDRGGLPKKNQRALCYTWRCPSTSALDSSEEAMRISRSSVGCAHNYFLPSMAAAQC